MQGLPISAMSRTRYDNDASRVFANRWRLGEEVRASSHVKSLKELRAIAEKATPGTWYMFWDTRVIKAEKALSPKHAVQKDWNIVRVPSRTMDYPISHDEYKANAEHIAAFNPATALALLDRIERLEKIIGSHLRTVSCDWYVSQFAKPRESVSALIENSGLRDRAITSFRDLAEALKGGGMRLRDEPHS